MRAVAAAAGILLGLRVLGGSAPASAAQATPLSFRTTDGVQIAATFYPANRKPSACVILLHALTRSRDDWQAVAARLADAGISALAIDLRGHGASGPDPAGGPGADDLSRDVLDVQAAHAFLASRPDLGVTAVGIAGADIGANLAVVAAAATPSIRSIALLSPGLDYRNIRTEAAFKKYGDRPALLVASEEDSYATRSIRRIEKGAASGTREVRLVNGAGHGTVMLARQPDLVALLVEWFQRTLR
ncbi:MAG: alpha/beta hydrolase [Bacteroidales bacterium]